MKTIFRAQEYKVLFYRIFLVYVFYFVVRALFLFYNFSLLGVDSISEFFRLYYYGLAFDTTAILYVNSLFILLSIAPVRSTTSKKYQKFLLYFYFVTNLIAYSLNFIDFSYTHCAPVIVNKLVILECFFCMYSMTYASYFLL